MQAAISTDACQPERSGQLIHQSMIIAQGGAGLEETIQMKTEFTQTEM